MSHLLNGVALVTGGGSGQATCLALIKHGIEKLAILDINPAGMGQTKHLIDEIKKADVLEVEVDVSNEHSVIKSIQRVVDHFGRIDVAINNAAVAGPISRSTDVSTTDFRKILDTNLVGLWSCQRETIKQMLKQDPQDQRHGPPTRGVIVNLSSTYGLVSPPGELAVPSYVASKHGIIGITKADANSFANDGIRINVICPGYVNTPGMQKAAESSDLVQKEQMKVPMGRFGEPSEIAEAICFLASPMSSYMTGSSLVVDGGVTSI